MKRFFFISFVALCMQCIISAQDKNGVTIGVVADVQYARQDKPGATRHYSRGVRLLEEAVEQFNKVSNLAFAVDLGDMTDRVYAEYADIAAVKTKLKADWHNVYGNHDFLTATSESDLKTISVLKGMEKPYYSIVRSRIRFIFLNCSDIATYSSIEGTAKNRMAAQWLEDLSEISFPSAQPYNGGIGLQQLVWLDKELSKADKKGQTAIVCCHMLIYPYMTKESLWNGMEVTHLIESHPSAKAVFCGHNHKGGYCERNGIHYLNFKGIVNGEDNHFSVVTINPSGKTIIIEGFGDEPDRTLTIR